MRMTDPIRMISALKTLRSHVHAHVNVLEPRRVGRRARGLCSLRRPSPVRAAAPPPGGQPRPVYMPVSGVYKVVLLARVYRRSHVCDCLDCGGGIRRERCSALGPFGRHFRGRRRGCACAARAEGAFHDKVGERRDKGREEGSHCAGAYRYQRTFGTAAGMWEQGARHARTNRPGDREGVTHQNKSRSSDQQLPQRSRPPTRQRRARAPG